MECMHTLQLVGHQQARRSPEAKVRHWHMAKTLRSCLIFLPTARMLYCRRLASFVASTRRYESIGAHIAARERRHWHWAGSTKRGLALWEGRGGEGWMGDRKPCFSYKCDFLPSPIWGLDVSLASHVEGVIELYTRRVVTVALRHMLTKHMGDTLRIPGMRFFLVSSATNTRPLSVIYPESRA